MTPTIFDDQLQAVCSTLDYAQIFGLECEVILFALLAMKDNSSLSIEDALYIGQTDWIK